MFHFSEEVFLVALLLFTTGPNYTQIFHDERLSIWLFYAWDFSPFFPNWPTNVFFFKLPLSLPYQGKLNEQQEIATCSRK
jgi:hypothetical protein